MIHSVIYKAFFVQRPERLTKRKEKGGQNYEKSIHTPSFFGILVVALVGIPANGAAGVDINIGINILRHPV